MIKNYFTEGIPIMLFHNGSSDQEEAATKFNKDISKINPNVRNRYDSFRLPSSVGDMQAAADRSTNKGINQLKKTTKGAVKQAAADTTKGAQSRGYGGAVLEDMIAKNRSLTSKQGTTAMADLLSKRAALDPQLMQIGNENALRLLSGAQGVDLQNMNNLFQKFGLQQGAIGMLSDETWLDDTMAILDTASNIGSAVAGFV